MHCSYIHDIGEVQSSLFIKYSIQSTSDCVNITCDFKQTSSATDCLVIVHQQISLVNTTGLMNIEVNWTQRLTRHGDTASGCIPGIDLDLYQIGVANGRKISGTIKR